MKRLEQVLWILFLIWSAIGLRVLALGLGPEWIAEHTEPGLLQDFLLEVERLGDAAWMALAALLLLVRAARASGWRRVLLAFAVVAVVSGAVEAVGATTGWPFGPYRYTDRFGPLLAGVVPLAIPLAWWVVVEGGRALAAALGLRGWAATSGAVLAAVLTDLNLEPVAWKIRGYWEWYPGIENSPSHPPLANYLAWAALAAVLVLVSDRLGVSRRRPWASGVVLVLVNVFFLAARMG